MFKSFSFSLVALLLVVSILAPSIEALCKSDYETMLVIDLNEEENNSKESEKKFDQKELFFTNSIESRSLYLGQEHIRSQTYLLSYSDFSSEIILPPPKSLI
jgi:hypothetical protein